MKAIAIVVLGLIPVAAYAQMTPNYSSYVSWTLDSSDKVYQTVVVDGQTTGSCYYTYPCNCNQYSCQQCQGIYAGCVGAVHTPSIHNVVAGVGGWSSGPSHDPFTYMSYQTTVSATVPENTDESSVWEGDVNCSSIGSFFGAGGTPTFRISTTYWGPPPITTQSGCRYNILACSTGTPTCKSATPGILFTQGCPNYAKAKYLVINGSLCEFSLGFSASGPGPCN